MGRVLYFHHYLPGQRERAYWESVAWCRFDAHLLSLGMQCVSFFQRSCTAAWSAQSCWMERCVPGAVCGRRRRCSRAPPHFILPLSCPTRPTTLPSGPALVRTEIRPETLPRPSLSAITRLTPLFSRIITHSGARVSPVQGACRRRSLQLLPLLRADVRHEPSVCGDEVAELALLVAAGGVGRLNAGG